MYTFLYFHKFVKKLCYKIKMPKRDLLPPLKYKQAKQLNAPIMKTQLMSKSTWVPRIAQEAL